MLEIVAEINSCKYLYLRGIGEPEENQLRIVIEEARGSAVTTLDLPRADILGQGRPIESTSDCRLFEIHWRSYIAYSVQNESYARPDDAERYSGRLFCDYEKSRFLDYTRQTTYSTAEDRAPFQHIGIHCLNHEIDVIATSRPQITRLRATKVPVI